MRYHFIYGNLTLWQLSISAADWREEWTLLCSLFHLKEEYPFLIMNRCWPTVKKAGSSLSSSVTIPFLSERQRALKFFFFFFYRGIAVSHKSLRVVFRVMFLFCFVHLFMFYSFVNTSKIPLSPKWSYCQVIVLFNSYIRLNQKKHLCSHLFRIKCD